MSPPEVWLWNRLRRSPSGIRFRKQYAVGPYVADFYCPAAKLVIEVDGMIHDFADAASHDQQKDAYLHKLGLRIVPLRARDVFANVDEIAANLVAMCVDLAGPSTTQQS